MAPGNKHIRDEISSYLLDYQTEWNQKIKQCDNCDKKIDMIAVMRNNSDECYDEWDFLDGSKANRQGYIMNCITNHIYEREGLKICVDCWLPYQIYFNFYDEYEKKHFESEEAFSLLGEYVDGSLSFRDEDLYDMCRLKNQIKKLKDKVISLKPKKKKQRRCGRCNRLGHNRKTCKETTKIKLI